MAAWWSWASPNRLFPDKIASIVFLDAFVPDNGNSMAELTNQAVRDQLKTATVDATHQVVRGEA